MNQNVPLNIPYLWYVRYIWVLSTQNLLGSKKGRKTGYRLFTTVLYYTWNLKILYIWLLKRFFDPGGVIQPLERLTYKISRVDNCSSFNLTYQTLTSDPGGGQGTPISEGDRAQTPKKLNRSDIFGLYGPPTGSYHQKKCFG